MAGPGKLLFLQVMDWGNEMADSSGTDLYLNFTFKMCQTEWNCVSFRFSFSEIHHVVRDEKLLLVTFILKKNSCFVHKCLTSCT